MTVFRLALLELQRFRGRYVRRTMLVLLILAPLVYGLSYLSAFWDPFGNMDRIPVAVVNEDAGTEINGKEVNAGDEFEAQLRASGELDWHFVSAKEAEKGLETGEYYFTVAVGENFSQRLASVTGDESQLAMLDVTLNDGNGYVAGRMADNYMPRLREQVNTAAYVSFAKTLFGDLQELHESLENADPESTSVANTATQLAADMHNLEKSISSAGDDVAQIADEIDQVNETLQSNRAALTESLDTMQAGAQTGNDVVTTAAQISDTELQELCPQGFDAQPCAELNSMVQEARTNETSMTSLNDAVQGLDSSESVTDAKNLQNLTDTVKQVSADLNGENGAVNNAVESSDHANALTEGTDLLANTMTALVSGVPQNDVEYNAERAAGFGSPVEIQETTENAAEVYGRGLTPMMFGLTLWVFGLVAYALLRPVNPRALAGKLNACKVTLAGWLPAFGLGIISMLILYIVMELGFGLDALDPFGLLVICVLGAASTTAVAQFLRHSLGQLGQGILLLGIMLQLVASGAIYPIEVTPRFFQILHPIMPFTYVVDGLRVTVSGGNGAHVWRAVLVLAAMTVVFVIASIWTTSRHRRWNMPRLRPPIRL